MTGIANGPSGGGLWQRDENSPHSFSGVLATTYTLADSWDEILINFVNYQNDSGAAMALQIQPDDGAGGWANGFNTRNFDGTTSSSTNQIQLANVADGQNISGFAYLDGRHGGTWTMTSEVRGPSADLVAHKVDATSPGSPTSDIRLIGVGGSGDYISGTIEVLGRNTP